MEEKKKFTKICRQCAFFVFDITSEGQCLYNPPVWASHAFRQPDVTADDFCHNWTPRSWFDEGPMDY